MKQVEGHAYAREVLTVTYTDKTVEKFYDVSEEQHEAFARSGFDDKAHPVPLTPEQQSAFLEKLKAR